MLSVLTVHEPRAVHRVYDRGAFDLFLGG